jgi:hypothetical protein
VLAAASPVFAALFRDNPIVEEDVHISIVGYSYTSLRSIIEYIYTGSLEFFERDKVTFISMLLISGRRKKLDLLLCLFYSFHFTGSNQRNAQGFSYSNSENEKCHERTANVNQRKN